MSDPEEEDDPPVLYRGLGLVRDIHQDLKVLRTEAASTGDLTKAAVFVQGLGSVADLHTALKADYRAQKLLWNNVEVWNETKRERARRVARKVCDTEDIEEMAGEQTGWEAVDLGPYLDGTITEAEPCELSVDRLDGSAVPVLYPGVNWLHGASGDGKSMLAALATAQVLTSGGTVVWIDYEEQDPATLCTRLLSMGVAAEVIATGLVFRHPMTLATPERLDELAVQAGGGVRLVVLDSVGEAFGVELVNENLDAEVAPWVNRVLRRLAAVFPLAAILPVDHSTKAQGRQLSPSGSKRKRAALTGIGLLVETETPFARGKPGQAALICGKDRHGRYRSGDTVAVLKVNGTDQGLSITLVERPAGEQPPPPVKVQAALEAFPVVLAGFALPPGKKDLLTSLRKSVKLPSADEKDFWEAVEDQHLAVIEKVPNGQKQRIFGPDFAPTS